MKISSTNLIAVLAITAGLLTSTAMAKGKGGGGNGGNHSSRSSSSMSLGSSNKSGSVKSFKLNSNNGNSSNHSNSISGISKKNLNLSQNFKKQDFNKDHKNSPLGISVNSIKKDNHSKDIFKKDYSKDMFKKNFSKDFFCKKDYCKKDFWWDSCYSKNYCYPYNFGCYFPTYSCYSPSYCYTPTIYDYCLPAYTTCNYGSYGSYVGSVNVLSNVNVEPSRTPVAVGSVLVVNGQAFGNNGGGARLRISGIAMAIEVLEWTPVGVTVRLPMVEINGGTPADIEVIRGDGSLAAKTAVVLVAPNEQVAFGR